MHIINSNLEIYLGDYKAGEERPNHQLAVLAGENQHLNELVKSPSN